MLGLWRANQGDHQSAAKTLNRALALARRSQDRHIAAFTLLMASLTASLMADTALAQTRAAESLRLSTELGNRRWAG